MYYNMLVNYYIIITIYSTNFTQFRVISISLKTIEIPFKLFTSHFLSLIFPKSCWFLCIIEIFNVFSDDRPAINNILNILLNFL